MISIKQKKDCCGCSACVQRCPKQCISMAEDEEGFLYPHIDENKCIDCGLCEKVCPVINQENQREPLSVYAATNPDEKIRMLSSSGGLFSMLAEKTIENGGVVFGACWNDEWEVVHDYTETVLGIAKFRGSKYVQSRIGDSYRIVEKFLKDGREVLFSGTPCQVAGLKKYLCKVYENLFLVDFICHGVPSPGVFRTYLQDEINKESARQGSGKNTVSHSCIPLVMKRDGIDFKELEINTISFRDKRNGWKKYGFVLGLSKVSTAGEKNSVSFSYSPLNKNLFLAGFLCDLYIRPSCYACPSKHLKSGSDITLADFWGIDSLMPELDDDKGVSAVTVNSEKGKATLHNLGITLHDVPYHELITRNPALVKSAAIPTKRTEFFKNDGLTFEEKIKKFAKFPFSIKRNVYPIIRKLIPNVAINILKRILR